MALAATTAFAGPREQAKRIHDRIAGVPPSELVLGNMEALLADANPANDIDAALMATNNPEFYRVTLKNFAASWTNRDQSQFVALNDYTATVIGLVRDELDFRQVLYGDIIYIGDPALGLPAYANGNNNHYEALENQGVDLQAELVQRTQSSVNGLPSDATAGVMTTRAGAQAFFIAGTNRAMLRFTLLNHLGRDLEQLQDTSRSPDRIRQDVSRSPGGDSRLFLNNCVGCHSGMDPLAQAFAYYNFNYDADNDPTGINGQMVYNDVGQTDPTTGTRVTAKHHINSTNFPFGYVTPDDGWDNYWRAGVNSLLGWDSTLTGSGNGAKSLGMELAHSRAFAEYQVTKVFRAVCLREPGDSNDRGQVTTITNSFIANGHNLKRVWAEVALYCKGE
ncbi:hypothetical protein QSV34_12525 [Porticoccus sp. W117]|uniref:hypothetical protein n=1 Tax=Porticoccus sp. W117 TaxID=3054777 RepID=UPI0025924AE6|nr:hypothetical protein [Porticoccus sp. W117]MDM3872171.1 hypothetical protein [Porticoccus sp. W117]